MMLGINRLSRACRVRLRAIEEAALRAGERDFRHGGKGRGAALSGVCGALLLFAVLVTNTQADPQSELAQARHDLLISEQVLARVSERVDAARSDPATAPEERRRLDEYLARVRDLVALNRDRVRSLEKAVVVRPAGSVPAGGSSTPRATTHAEEVAALDARLSGSLTEFDQLLLEEARKARARAPTRASAATSAGGSRGEANDRGTEKSGRDGTRETDAADSGRDNKDSGSSSGTGPGAPGGRIEGTDPGAPGATAAVPPDVGDGSDDDIVARQIRRAAESETDPELREKLWDEYRKYKQGTKG